MAITTLSDQILEIAGDAIFLIERNGTIVRANKTANRMMTESGSGIRTGQPFWEFLNDLSGDDWEAIVKPLNISGPVSMRDTVSTASGETSPVAIDLHLVRCGTDETICAFLQDLSWAQGQQEQIESLAKFPAENPNPVMRITAEGRVIYANEGSRCLLDVWNASDSRQLPKEW